MISEAKQTASWLWDVIRNPDVVWLDGNTGGEASRERWKRIDRFRILRPTWTFYFLTTKQGCGCRKRFGLWRTIICSDHVAHSADWNDREGG